MKDGFQFRVQTTRLFAGLARTHPARLTLFVYMFMILVLWALLMLPISTSSGAPAPTIDALFMALSAVCVAGLATVPTDTFWSFFGEASLAVGMFVGGIGIMTLASLFAFAVSSHLGLTQRMLMRDSTSTGALSDTGRIVLGAILTSAIVQAVVFLFLAVRFLVGGTPFWVACWDALFMAISAFNNAGLVNFPAGSEHILSEWGVVLPVTLAAMIGAIGFPVVTEIRQRWRTPRRWSLHTKITLSVFFSLIGASMIGTMALEWTNPATLASASVSDKLLATILSGMSPRSLGVSLIPVQDMRPASHLLLDVFMFIGGGSASTAGGIKVTTFAVLVLAMVAEAQGNNDVEVYRRRMPAGTVRLAVAVLVVSAFVVITGLFALLLLTDFTLNTLLFETISAYGTVGLSMGITPMLPWVGKLILGIIMLVGRLGPMTLATALALTSRHNLVRMPEARPIVG